MKRILVVEDEESIRELICLNLEKTGFTVLGAGTGEEAVEIFTREGSSIDVILLDIMLPGISGLQVCKQVRQLSSTVGIIMLTAKTQEMEGSSIDVILLDIMLPGISGLQVCKQVRQLSSTVGIIMLTAKTQEMDKISGLMLGADDYVTKPFSVSELMARVDAIYRRVAMSGGGQTSTLHYGPFEMNLKSRVLRKNGDPVELTQVEYQIMELFLKNPDTVLDRMEILKSIWGENYYGDDKIIDVNIRRLRMKIEEEPSRPRHITTVWSRRSPPAPGTSPPSGAWATASRHSRRDQTFIKQGGSRAYAERDQTLDAQLFDHHRGHPLGHHAHRGGGGAQLLLFQRRADHHQPLRGDGQRHQEQPAVGHRTDGGVDGHRL